MQIPASAAAEAASIVTAGGAGLGGAATLADLERVKGEIIDAVNMRLDAMQAAILTGVVVDSLYKLSHTLSFASS